MPTDAATKRSGRELVSVQASLLGMDIKTLDLVDDPDAVAKLQDEVMALIGAWSDRGIAPSEASMVLAGMAHMILAKLGFSLSMITELLSKTWRNHNGKP